MSAVFVCEYRAIRWPGSGYVHAFEVHDVRTLCGRHPVKLFYKDARGVWGWHRAYPWAERELGKTGSIDCKECRRRYERTGVMPM